MNRIKNTIKTHVHAHPTPYIATAVITGMSVGVVLATKFGMRPTLNEHAVLMQFQEAIKEQGGVVLIVAKDAAESIKNLPNVVEL